MRWLLISILAWGALSACAALLPTPGASDTVRLLRHGERVEPIYTISLYGTRED